LNYGLKILRKGDTMDKLKLMKITNEVR